MKVKQEIKSENEPPNIQNTVSVRVNISLNNISSSKHFVFLNIICHNFTNLKP